MANEGLPANLLRALKELKQAFDSFRIRYALIGGIAAGYRSRPRFTQDVDFLLEVPQVVLPRLLDDLHARGFQFDTETVLKQWTREHLTQLEFRGVRVDWLKPVLPIYQHVLDGARKEALLDGDMPIATPEGLILTKLLAWRGQDQVDIENIVAASAGHIDMEWIRTEWQSVAGADDARLQKLLDMVERCRADLPNH